jgi:ABC-type uncharacterized transport system permease subunit
MTFLQQTLGKNYKWYYIAKYSAKNSMAGISVNLIYMIAGIMEIGTYIYLYYINKSIDFEQVITYFMLARVYSSFVMNRWYHFIGDLIFSSGLTRFLLFPTNYFLHNFMLSVGGRFVRNVLGVLINLGVVGLLVAFGITKLSISMAFWFILPLVPVCFCLNFVICMIAGHLAFFIKDKRDFGGFCEIYYMLSGVLSGVIIPLYLIPIKWLEYTPFAYLTAQPLRLYQNPSLGLFLEIFGIVIGWTVVMFFGNRIVFRLGLKRNEAVGL